MGSRGIAQTLDLKPEQIMAFGDEWKWHRMLELAGISYAMENAESLSKKVATVAPANSQAGVCKFWKLARKNNLAVAF